MTETLIEAPATRPTLHVHAAADFVAVDLPFGAAVDELDIVSGIAGNLDVEARVSNDDRMARRERLLHQLALERRRQRRRRIA